MFMWVIILTLLSQWNIKHESSDYHSQPILDSIPDIRFKHQKIHFHTDLIWIIFCLLLSFPARRHLLEFLQLLFVRISQQTLQNTIILQEIVCRFKQFLTQIRPRTRVRSTEQIMRCCFWLNIWWFHCLFGHQLQTTNTCLNTDSYLGRQLTSVCQPIILITRLTLRFAPLA